MAEFSFGLLMGYFIGIAVEHYVTKIDKEMKNDRQ
jgi:hypothetical protein